MDTVVGSFRRWWWRRGHRRFYRNQTGRTDLFVATNPYALNAGSREAFDSLITGLREIVEPLAKDVVLDLGGGNGYVSAELFGACRKVVVLDLCRPPGELRSSFVLADMQAPPFRAGAFTKLFSYSTFPCVGSTTAARTMLDVWDRLLAPNGVLFIGDIPDRSKLTTMLARGLSKVASANGLKYYFAVSMISTFSRNTLKRHLESIGYEVTLINQPPTRRFYRERFDLLAHKHAPGCSSGYQTEFSVR